MKKLYFLFSFLVLTGMSFGQDLLITAAYDGPLPGGTPKGVELYVVNNIADLSIYGIGSANNGGGTDGEEFTFPADNVTAGTYLYVASETTEFTNFFGFAPDYVTGAMGINGDDAVELFLNGAVTDVFGDINMDGTGQPWDHVDGWAYRVDGTGPDGSTFNELNWTFSGTNALDGEADNATAANPIPIGTYSTTGSTTPTVNTTGSPGNMFYFEGTGPSGEESFSVSGINLTNDIVINATGPEFEFSLTSGGTFTPSVSITPSSGTVTSTPVYVRMVMSLTAANYAADANVTSTGATSQTVALTGTVAPADPFIDFNGGVGSLTYNEGSGPSAEDSFFAGGMFLTEDITITAPTNFEISLTSGSGFGSSVMVTQTGGTAADTEIFIRLADGLPQGMYSGDVIATSTGAPNETLSVSGEVFPSATCANTGDIIVTEIFQNATGSDTGKEWFEVYNTTGAPIDMIGWVIRDNDTDSHTINASVVVPDGGYIVFGSNADSMTNGGVTVAYEYSGINLANGADEVVIECSSTIIDAVLYDGGPNFPDPDGASMELSTTALDDISNDDGANWGEGTMPFGDGDLGTPGGANDFTLSISQFEVNTVKVFPNPNATGILNITSNGETLSVIVFDVLGKQVLNTQVTDNTIDIANLNSGLYLIKISQNNNTITKKLIVK